MVDAKLINKQIEVLLKEEPYEVTKLANAAALIYEDYPDLSWVGFYLLKGEFLYLGPFQGKVACTRIPVGVGVCGTCVAKKETILVNNVHEFPGHIACDSASNSEIVVPLFKEGNIYGVLDIDSTTLNRFNETDKTNIESIAKTIERIL